MLPPKADGSGVWDMFQKRATFKGNKERLHRFVQRANGKMLGNQRFCVNLKDKRVKCAFSLRFHCRYQKVDDGYEILYFITPILFDLVCSAVLLALLCWLLWQKQINPYFTLGFGLIACFIN